MTPIDWTIFDKYPENTVTCRCDAVYRSHTKVAISDDGQMHVFCRKPCPACGSATDPWRAASEPEEYVIEKPHKPLYGDNLFKGPGTCGAVAPDGSDPTRKKAT